MNFAAQVRRLVRPPNIDQKRLDFHVNEANSEVTKFNVLISFQLVDGKLAMWCTIVCGTAF